MRKNQLKRAAAFCLGLLMVFSIISTIPVSAQNGNDQFPQTLGGFDDITIAALTAQLDTEPGMHGFYGDYALDNPFEVVEIIVEFVTPAAVAGEAMEEAGIVPQGEISPRNRARNSHVNFRNQLDGLRNNRRTGRRGTAAFQNDTVVIEEDFTEFFNGVVMSVTADMVEDIAGLPEVAAVFPNARIVVPATALPVIPAYGFTASTVTTDNSLFMQSVREYFGLGDDALPRRSIHNARTGLGRIGEGAVVAVIDTGIDHNHPEFAPFRDMITIDGHSAYRIRGFDFIDEDYDPAYDPMDPFRHHGTEVTGAIVGMAPGVQLLHYRVSGFGVGNVSHIISAITRAALGTPYRPGAGILPDEPRADIINISLQVNNANMQHTNPWHIVNRTINNAVISGVTVIVAAGNNPNPGSGNVSERINLLAEASLALTVGAGTAGGVGMTTDIVWNNSRRGPVRYINHTGIDVVAPGVNIMTTHPGGGYVLRSGTSMSAGIVTGLAALIRGSGETGGRGLHSTLPNSQSPTDIMARIMNNARPLNSINSEHNSVFTVGAGFIQPYESIVNNVTITFAGARIPSHTDVFATPEDSVAEVGGMRLVDATISLPVLNFGNLALGLYNPATPVPGFPLGYFYTRRTITITNATNFSINHLVDSGTPFGRQVPVFITTTDATGRNNRNLANENIQVFIQQVGATNNFDVMVAIRYGTPISTLFEGVIEFLNPNFTQERVWSQGLNLWDPPNLFTPAATGSHTIRIPFAGYIEFLDHGTTPTTDPMDPITNYIDPSLADWIRIQAGLPAGAVIYRHHVTNLGVTHHERLDFSEWRNDHPTGEPIRSLHGFQFFPNLRYLDLSNNELTGIIDFSSPASPWHTSLNANVAVGLSELRELNLSGNAINDLWVDGLEHLRILEVDYNRRLFSIQASNLTNLQSFEVSDRFNDLSGVTSVTMIHAINLSEFVINNNPLTTVNLYTSSTNPSRLELVDVSNNVLTTLVTAHAVNLRTLLANNNDLANLEIIRLLNLERLELSNNRLTQIGPGGLDGHETLQSLTHFIIDNNRFGYPPAPTTTEVLNVNTLTRLVELNINDNYFTGILFNTSDVSEITHLGAFTTLRARNNRITAHRVADRNDLVNYTGNNETNLNLRSLPLLDIVDLSGNVMRGLDLRRVLTNANRGFTLLDVTHNHIWLNTFNEVQMQHHIQGWGTTLMPAGRTFWPQVSRLYEDNLWYFNSNPVAVNYTNRGTAIERHLEFWRYGNQIRQEIWLQAFPNTDDGYEFYLWEEYSPTGVRQFDPGQQASTVIPLAVHTVNPNGAGAPVSNLPTLNTPGHFNPYARPSFPQFFMPPNRITNELQLLGYSTHEGEFVTTGTGAFQARAIPWRYEIMRLDIPWDLAGTPGLQSNTTRFRAVFRYAGTGPTPSPVTPELVTLFIQDLSPGFLASPTLHNWGTVTFEFGNETFVWPRDAFLDTPHESFNNDNPNNLGIRVPRGTPVRVTVTPNDFVGTQNWGGDVDNHARFGIELFRTRNTIDGDEADSATRTHTFNANVMAESGAAVIFAFNHIHRVTIVHGNQTTVTGQMLGNAFETVLTTSYPNIFYAISGREVAVTAVNTVTNLPVTHWDDVTGATLNFHAISGAERRFTMPMADVSLRPLDTGVPPGPVSMQALATTTLEDRVTVLRAVGQEGVPFFLQFESTNVADWGIDGGTTLPRGLRLNSDTGIIHGVPEVGGLSSTITVVARNPHGSTRSRVFEIDITHAPLDPPQIIHTNPAYVNAHGAIHWPPVTGASDFIIEVTNFRNGVMVGHPVQTTITADGSSLNYVELSSLFLQHGSNEIRIRSLHNATQRTSAWSATIVIERDEEPRVSFPAVRNLPVQIGGEFIAIPFRSSGSMLGGNYRWHAVLPAPSGLPSLASSLTMDPDTGILHGILPTVVEGQRIEYVITIRIKREDSAGNWNHVDSRDYVLTVVHRNDAPPGMYVHHPDGGIFPANIPINIGSIGTASTGVIPPMTLPAVVNESFTHTFLGDGITYWTHMPLSGPLPPGITLNSRAGILSGTPTQAGTWAFQIRADNPENHMQGTNPFTVIINVAPAAVPPVTNISLSRPPGNVYHGQNVTINASILPVNLGINTLVWTTTTQGLTISGTGLSVTANTQTLAVNTQVSITATVPGTNIFSTINFPIAPAAPPPVTGITLSRPAGNVYHGQNVEITATVTPANLGIATLEWTTPTPGLTISGTGLSVIANTATLAVNTQVTIIARVPGTNTSSNFNFQIIQAPGGSGGTGTQPTQFTLTVQNSPNLAITGQSPTGNSSRTMGSSFTIVAGNPPTGYVFSHWSGANFGNPNSATTTMTMPSSATTITANWTQATTTVVAPVQNAPVGTIVHWNNVPGNHGFRIYVAGTHRHTVTAGITQFELNSLAGTTGVPTGTPLSVTIRTVGPGTNNFSAHSNPQTVTLTAATLGVPVVTASGMTLSWPTVTGATRYYLYVNGIQNRNLTNALTVSNNVHTLNLATLTNPVIPTGNQLFQIRAFNANNNTSSNLNAGHTINITATQLATPQTTLTGNNLTWPVVPNASAIELLIDGQVLRSMSAATISLNLANENVAAGQRTVSIRAVGQGNFTTSQPSTAITFTFGGGGAGGQVTQSTIPVNQGTRTTNVQLSGDTVTVLLPTAPRDQLINASQGNVSFDTRAAQLPSTRMQALAVRAFGENNLGVEIINQAGVMQFSAQAANALAARAPTLGVITFHMSLVQQSALSAAEVDQARGNPVYRVTIAAGTDNAEGTPMTALGGNINITVPYTMGGTPGVWRMLPAGGLEPIAGVTHNTANNTITFTVNNLSLFVVAPSVGGAPVVFGQTPPPTTPTPTPTPPPTQPPTPPPAALDGPIIRFVIGNRTFTHLGQSRLLEAAPFLDTETGRTMVPFRVIGEALGAQVDWVPATRTVIFDLDGVISSMVIDQPLPNDGGVPVIVNGVTFVPVRFVSTALGAFTHWNAQTRAVYVYEESPW